MKKIQQQFIVITAVLTGVALCLAAGAAHRGDSLAVIVMLIIATIFWGKVQKRR
jgi:uncharacterized membrane protein